jgi:hypothetical protein
MGREEPVMPNQELMVALGPGEGGLSCPRAGVWITYLHLQFGRRLRERERERERERNVQFEIQY